ncbi:MAG: hypothetical protein QOH28_3088 [Actinomycetota bacterium]|jgi:hypothetical protein|nr:hypothetical protein [Actinomycetota bacterium]
MFGRRAIQTQDGQPAKRRREGTGLGPFTSGHLTIIVVTLVIVVAFPFAAFAVTGNNVFVTDATSGVPAKVDASGNLQAKLNATTVGVTGNVGAPAAATNFAHGIVNVVASGSSTCVNLLSPPTGKALVVGTISIDTYEDGSPNLNYSRFWRSAGCASDQIATHTPNGPGTQQLLIQPGVTVKAGQALSVQAVNAGTTSLGADIAVFGYLVPASAVPAAPTAPSLAPHRPAG